MKSWRCSKASGEAKAARRRDSRSLWKAYVHRRTMILYLVGIIRRDGGTEGDKEISSRLWMFSAKLEIKAVLDKKYSKDVQKRLTFYDHSFVSFISLFQGRHFRPPYP